MKTAKWKWSINQLVYKILKSVLLGDSGGLRITNKAKLHYLIEKLLTGRINRTNSEGISVVAHW